MSRSPTSITMYWLILPVEYVTCILFIPNLEYILNLEVSDMYSSLAQGLQSRLKLDPRAMPETNNVRMKRLFGTYSLLQ